MGAGRESFAEKVLAARTRLIDLCVELVQVGSENPPGDTSAISDAVVRILSDVPGLSVERVEAKEGIVNLVARLRCGIPGRRLVINGHLDTFPVGDASRWTVPPLSGTMADGRIYGRGAGDMKAGLATGLMTAILIAEERERLCGELVLAFVGDEETGGEWGTGYLLKHVPEASGDAMLSGDAGSPQILRFGEKGQIWIELMATGTASHGAHVHLGRNAIDALIEAVEAVGRLRDLPCALPAEILAAMEEAKPVSEPLSGEGEFDTLQRVTVNLGVIEGGTSINIVPDSARALLDIRTPPGVTTRQIVDAMEEIVRDRPTINFRVLTATDPTATDPNHKIVELTLANAKALLGKDVVKNMRVGMSDARLYRNHGVPSVVYGPTPHNMGGVDEYVEAEDLYSVLYVHAMTAYDYLSSSSERPGTGV